MDPDGRQDRRYPPQDYFVPFLPVPGRVYRGGRVQRFNDNRLVIFMDDTTEAQRGQLEPQHQPSTNAVSGPSRSGISHQVQPVQDHRAAVQGYVWDERQGRCLPPRGSYVNHPAPPHRRASPDRLAPVSSPRRVLARQAATNEQAPSRLPCHSHGYGGVRSYRPLLPKPTHQRASVQQQASHHRHDSTNQHGRLSGQELSIPHVANTQRASVGQQPLTKQEAGTDGSASAGELTYSNGRPSAAHLPAACQYASTAQHILGTQRGPTGYPMPVSQRPAMTQQIPSTQHPPPNLRANWGPGQRMTCNQSAVTMVFAAPDLGYTSIQFLSHIPVPIQNSLFAVDVVDPSRPNRCSILYRIFMCGPADEVVPGTPPPQRPFDGIIPVVPSRNVPDRFRYLCRTNNRNWNLAYLAPRTTLSLRPARWPAPGDTSGYILGEVFEDPPGIAPGVAPGDAPGYTPGSARAYDTGNTPRTAPEQSMARPSSTAIPEAVSSAHTTSSSLWAPAWTGNTPGQASPWARPSTARRATNGESDLKQESPLVKRENRS